MMVSDVAVLLHDELERTQEDIVTLRKQLAAAQAERNWLMRELRWTRNKCGRLSNRRQQVVERHNRKMLDIAWKFALAVERDLPQTNH